MNFAVRRFFSHFALASACVVVGLAQDNQKSKNFDPSQETAVIEALKTSVRFENDGTTVQTIQRHVKVQNAAGVKKYGILLFDYVASDTLNIDYIEVHKSGGAVIKVGPENARETTPPISREAPMYSDLHRKDVTIPSLSVGDELSIQSTYKSISLIPGQFWFEHSFTKDEVVLSETVEVNVPKARKLHVKSAAEYKPEIKDSGDRTTYVWAGLNKQPKEMLDTGSFYDDLATARKNPPPDIQLSTFESWKDIGSWYGSLQRDRMLPGPAVKAKTLELTQGLATPEARLKVLYDYVSSNFRYISIDFGIGRYQPHSADQVLTNGYGDCKDKHTLLASMLQAAGIEALPVLMNSKRLIDPDVPSPAQFDHVITAIRGESGYTFLDTTVETAPYGLLFYALRGKKAMLVLPGNDGVRFEETPLNPPGPVQETFELNGKVDSSGTLEADVVRHVRGDAEIMMGTAFHNTPPSGYKDIVQAMSYASGFLGETSDVKIKTDPATGLTIAYHYHRPEYFDFSEKRPAKSVPLPVALPEMSADQESLHLYFSPGELLFKCRIELPEGVTAAPPLAVKVERDYVRFESVYSAQKNIVTAEKKLTILKPEVGASQRQDYAAFREAVLSDDAQEIVLRAGPGFEPNMTALNSSDLDNLMNQGERSVGRNDYQRAYQAFRKVADQDPKHKEVWTELGLTEAYLGRRDQGIRDIQKQIEVDPFDVRAHAELGFVYLMDRRNVEAIRELNKALQLDPLAHRPHYLLGYHYFTSKDYANAVPELEKGMATDQPRYNDEAQIRTMLASAYFKVKQPEKGAELLKQQVETSPDPATWNNAAYELAENDFQLDQAKEYAQLAVHALSEQLDRTGEDALNAPDMVKMSLLINAWDTLGWVYFKLGALPTAEKYIHAAWMMSQHEVQGEHLGQIYEKLGRAQEAIRYYAMSAREYFSTTNGGANDLARTRLVKLVGQQRAQALIEKYHGEPSQLRTFHLARIAPVGTKAEILLVYGPRPKIESMRVLNGDNSVLDGLKKSSLPIAKMVAFPDDGPVKLAREGFLTCSRYTPGCDLVLNIVWNTTLSLDGASRTQRSIP